jgi:hypothetical protein
MSPLEYCVKSDRVDLIVAMIVTATGSFLVLILACAFG